MRTRRRRTVLPVIVVAVLLVVPGGSFGARKGGIAPPYADSGTGGGHDCIDPVEVCTLSASADPATGAIAVSASTQSLLLGLGPDFGLYSYAEGWIVAAHHLRKSAPQLTYTVSLHVSSADASYSGTGDGYAEVYAFVNSDTCGCTIGYQTLVFSGDPPISGQDMTLEFILSGPVAPGDHTLTVSLAAGGYISLGTGTAGGSVDAVVTGITVA
jgi:hypothetical protein